MKTKDKQFLTSFLLVLYIVVLIRNAWISDDAYISFRAIENFIAGYGLNFNPYVRVQVYTHPLWMLLVSAIYFIQVHILDISRDNGLYFLVIALSILIAGGAFYLTLHKLTKNNFYSKLSFGIIIISSKAFIDYSTSGLENPLSYLLLGIFIITFLREKQNLFALTFHAALLFVNRPDMILLVFPALIFSFGTDQQSWKRKFRNLFFGLLPMFFWELFSLLYYGFPFPNTAYAKLNTGITKAALLTQGIDYFIDSLTYDPVTLFVILLTGIGIAIEKEKKSIAAYTGILFYLVYILYIGGDFMSGRFFAAPFFLSAIFFSRLRSFSKQVFLTAVASILLLMVYSGHSPLMSLTARSLADKSSINNVTKDKRIDMLIGDNGIADEKAIYFSPLGLTELGVRHAKGGSFYAGKKWIFTGIKDVTMEISLGQVAYYKGPNFYITDHLALSDPLLARLPTHDKVYWRSGHFWRAKPKGYIQTLKNQENLIENKDLAQYYDKLKILTEAPIWTVDRFVLIWEFNTGQYDYLLEKYLETINQ